MAKFNEVIIAIAKSVAEAEAQLEEVQLSNLSKYFKKKKGRQPFYGIDEYLPGIFPIRLKIGVPDENNEYGNKYYCVPYINLIPISQLNIDSVNASFDIGVIELIQPKKSNNNKSIFNNVYDDDDIVVNIKDFENSSNISVDVTGAGLDKCKGTTINVNISISKTETSDGMSRLINEITNLSQGFIEIKDDKKDIVENDINNEN